MFVAAERLQNEIKASFRILFPALKFTVTSAPLVARLIELRLAAQRDAPPISEVMTIVFPRAASAYT